MAALQRTRPVIFLAFANSSANPLPHLAEECRRLTDILEDAAHTGTCDRLVRSYATVDQILDAFHCAGPANGCALLLAAEVAIAPQGCPRSGSHRLRQPFHSQGVHYATTYQRLGQEVQHRGRALRGAARQAGRRGRLPAEGSLHHLSRAAGNRPATWAACPSGRVTPTCGRGARRTTSTTPAGPSNLFARVLDLEGKPVKTHGSRSSAGRMASNCWASPTLPSTSP